MARRFQKINVTGSVNSLVLDTGLESTEQERVRVVKVHLAVSGSIGNTVEGYVRQKQEIQIDDRIMDQANASGTNQFPSTNKLRTLEMDRELAVGERLQVGIRSGGTATNLFGAYEYEVM